MPALRVLWFSLAAVSARAAAPDFFAATDWNDGKAEMLYYDVVRSYRGQTLKESAVWITEAGFYRAASGEFVRARDSAAVDVLQATLRRPGAAEEAPLSAVAVLKWDRKKPSERWWQKVSLNGVYGGHWRSVVSENGKISLRVESTGGEAARSQEGFKPPLYTEEMLFTHLRTLPQRLGTVEEVWLLDSQLADEPAYKSQYARIEVEKEAVLARELDACLIRVARADGKVLQFWVHRQGLHPVIKAKLADGSEWTLQRWERKKYWSF